MFLVGLLTGNPPLREVFVPEEEGGKNVEILQTHSNALDWIRSHGTNMREVVDGNLNTI